MDQAQGLWKFFLGDILAKNGGLAALILAGCLWLLWKIASMWLRKEEAETNATVTASSGVEIMEKLLNDERAEKVRLQGELTKANQDYRDLVASQMQRHADSIKEVQKNHDDAIQRLHQRLDQAIAAHHHCEANLRKVISVLEENGIKGLPEPTHA